MSQSNQVGDTDEDASIQPQNEATHASSRAAPSSSNSRAKRKSSKTWSDMWNHFTKFVMRKVSKKLDAITAIKNIMLISKQMKPQL